MDKETRGKMVEEWGLAGFSQEEQDEFIDKIGQALYQSVVMRATDEMSDEQQDIFETFLEQAGEKADLFTVLDYLHTNVQGFDDMLAEETEKLKKELLAAAA